MRRQRRGVCGKRGRASPADVLLSYAGLDGRLRRPRCASIRRRRSSTASSASLPAQAAAGRTLRPCSSRSTCNGGSRQRRRRSYEACSPRIASIKRSTRGVATVETSNALFNEVLCRSMADLYMLMTETPQGPYPYAGIPWYSTTFGRDGIITAMQMLWCRSGHRARRADAARALSGQGDDPIADAQPGKILHEMRDGEMAALREVPFGLYYGSVNSTPLFVLLAGLYAQRTGDWKRRARCGRISRRRSAGSTALAIRMATASSNTTARPTRAWSTRAGRIRSRCASSMPTDAWRKGRSRSPRCRVTSTRRSSAAAQCARLAWPQRAGGLARCAGGPDSPSASKRRSGARRSAPMRWRSTATSSRAAVRTSNAGHVLFTRHRAGRSARSESARGLMRPQFFSGWGIRTVSSEEAPLQSDVLSQRLGLAARQRLIALGFARYGLKSASRPGVHGHVRCRDLYGPARLPELFCGFRARPEPRADALSGRLLAAGLGQRHALRPAAGLARAGI